MGVGGKQYVSVLNNDEVAFVVPFRRLNLLKQQQ